MTLEQLLQTQVALALDCKFRLELANKATGQPMTREERAHFLMCAFFEISKGMGIDRLMQTPAERLDQFAVMSVMKDHDTAGLLRSLVNSFMIAYACPETSDRAFAALVQIEGLRAEVAESKGQGRMSNKPELVAAAAKLDALLKLMAGPGHTEKTPIYKVLVGADRLYVKSVYAFKDMPSAIDGLPVEFSVSAGTFH